jgi:hypothetical protein
MTFTIQQLEALCLATNPGPWKLFGDHIEADNGHSVCDTRDYEDANFIAAARTAIPELIARIRELDPAFRADAPPESVARATQLMREAAEKRAKLEKALSDAQLGDMRELNALGLEAFFDVDGQVKIRQKPRIAG